MVSIDHGLKTRLNSVVERCLAAGAKASPQFRVDTLRIDSKEHLETYYNPELRSLLFETDLPDDAGLHRTGIRVENRREAQSPASSQYPSDDVGKCLSPMAATKYTLRCHWSPLHVAAARDDVVLLRLLLDHSENANSPGIGVCPCYYRPLRRTIGRSVSEGHITTDHGFQEFLDRKLVTRWSPLHVAICNGHLKCAEMLINRFGLPHTEETAEEVAEQAQWFTKEIRHLESTGGIPRPSWYPPDYSILEDWLFHGWCSNLTPRFDPSPPLHIAAETYTSLGEIETVYLMLKKADYFEDPREGLDVLDAFADTPFAVASFSGRAQTNGAWLRERGADINFTMEGLHDHTIFQELCRCGRYQNAIVLMDMGVHVDNYALSIICSSYNPRYKTEEAMVLMNRLIDAGVDINDRTYDWRGRTPLMAAICRPFPAATRMLIHAGADVHAVSSDGQTALHVAVDRCSSGELRTALATIELLIDHGADPNYRSNGMASPLFTSSYSLRPGTTTDKFIQDHAEGGPHGFHVRGYYPPPHTMASIAPLMIRKGADPNIFLRRTIHPRDDGGRSLALSAFFLGEFDSLDALATYGAIITKDQYLFMMRSLIDFPSRPRTFGPVDALFRILNGPSLELQQPEDRKHIMNAWEEVLYHAVGRHPSLVHTLVPRIVLTDIRGLGGKNVLHLMARWERFPALHPDIFRCRITRTISDLMQCGAYHMINEIDDDGNSPLQTAIDLGNTPAVISLMEHGADCHSETENPNGTMTVSPLKSAIRRYTEACYYDMASEMLAMKCQHHIITGVRNARYLKDFVLNLRERSFDEPSHAIARTMRLMKGLIGLGAEVNETDSDGNTPLHLLLSLLASPGDTTITPSSGSPGNTVNRCSNSKIVFNIDRPRLFELYEEEGMPMNGQPAYGFYRDADYWVHVGGSESDTDIDGLSDDSFVIDEGEAVSEAGGTTYLWTQTNPASQTHEHEEIKLGPDFVNNGVGAWTSAFIFLLIQGASLTAGNNAGETALDYIDEFRRRPPRNSPDFYSSVILYLHHSVKRPPFDPKLRVHFDGSRVTAQGSPALFLHDPRHQLGAEKDRPAYTLQSCARGESSWVPFW